MFKALWLWLLGPIWEVRIISTKTGKDLPGRFIYKGGYWQARKQFRHAKAKTTDIVRLQAVIRADWRHGHVEPANDVPHETTDEPSHDIYSDLQRQNEFMHKHQDEPNVDYDHDCDENGPLEWDETGRCYVPTCSTCGKLN